MENFIPFLIGIALFIYKIWSNFTKEQEKARKRSPGRPVSSEAKPADHKRGMNTSIPTPTKTPQPFLLEEMPNSNDQHEPKYKHIYERERRSGKEHQGKAYESGNHEILLSKEGYNPEEVADEIKTSRKIHKAPKHRQVVIQEEEEVPVEFDMKSAVIAEAILNRPKF
ncbi:hypothetical protein [Desertivirga brevis]|uniref:hypothetical protein n=1 Tax=Desertivirga brevis TaxID=2810310 RepID=UPI001A95AEBC|nr:hypothetical protein [Pedobacter sp. SYSU D00873]